MQSQSTLATIGGLAKGGAPVIKPLKQKIQVGATAYELQEIYGIEGQPVDGRILTQTLTSTLTLTLSQPRPSHYP